MKIGLTESVVTDSLGNSLTQKQQEYFTNSKIRDKNGKLLVMYHGTSTAGFSEFDVSPYGEFIGSFFTDQPIIAGGYLSNEVKHKNDLPSKYAKVKSMHEVKHILDILDNSDIQYEVIYTVANDKKEFEDGLYNYYKTPMDVFEHEPDASKNGIVTVYEITDEDGYKNRYDELDLNTAIHHLGLVQSRGDAIYECYLNITNPLVYYANGDYWDNLFLDQDDLVTIDYFIDTLDDEIPFSELDRNETVRGDLTVQDLIDAENSRALINPNTYEIVYPMTTHDVVDVAKDEGYDGVIFFDLVDNANSFPLPSTVVVAFNANQIKSIYNKTPTNSSDLTETVERVKTDSLRNKLTSEQSRFFKDSKMRNRNGKLQVVYHGTDNDFTTFRKSNGQLGKYGSYGIFFADYKTAKSYGQVKPVYLNAKKVLTVDADRAFANRIFTDVVFNGRTGKGDFTHIDDIAMWADEHGYDGVIVKNVRDNYSNDNTEHVGNVYIVFEPNQIKSIDNVNPTESDDIMEEIL